MLELSGVLLQGLCPCHISPGLPFYPTSYGTTPHSFLFVLFSPSSRPRQPLKIFGRKRRPPTVVEASENIFSANTVF